MKIKRAKRIKRLKAIAEKDGFIYYPHKKILVLAKDFSFPLPFRPHGKA